VGVPLFEPGGENKWCKTFGPYFCPFSDFFVILLTV
jgi:hypothetical protein